MTSFSLLRPTASDDTINLILDNVKLTGGKSGIAFHSALYDVRSTFYDNISLHNCLLKDFSSCGIDWDCPYHYAISMARMRLTLDLSDTTVTGCGKAGINLTTECSAVTLKLDNCDISGNNYGVTQNERYGIDPSFSSQSGLSTTIQHSRFENNSNSALCLDLLMKDSTHTLSSITDCVFSQNKTGGNGGAICMDGYFGSVITLGITGCTFSGNIAEGSGNAIYAGRRAPKVTMTNCILDSADDVVGNVTIC